MAFGSLISASTASFSHRPNCTMGSGSRSARRRWRFEYSSRRAATSRGVGFNAWSLPDNLGAQLTVSNGVGELGGQTVGLEIGLQVATEDALIGARDFLRRE